jgi:hypothetical protein
MKKTIVLCSTNRGVFEPTRKLVNELKIKGCLYVQQSGASCVALARNFALTSACDVFDEAPLADTLLMLDDDMDATVSAVESVIDWSRKLRRACSATYINSDGSLAHSAIKDSRLWSSGLGLLAIPRATILQLRDTSPIFSSGRRSQVFAFTEAKMVNGKWSSEDYTFSARLGGVVVLPVEVGHLKLQSLRPNELQLSTVAGRFEEFRNGKR